MISSAHICYDTRHVSLTLASIAEYLREHISWQISTTEWRGYGMVVPQLLVHTPIPFLLQIENDPAWVPAEIQEIIEWEKIDPASEIGLRIARCDARLAIQSTVADQVFHGGNSITVSTFGHEIDASNMEISKVLNILCRHIGGVIHDCVNGGAFVC